MHRFKTLCSASLMGLGMLYGSSALAAPQTFVIDMDCTDCAEAADLTSYPVQAVLTLDNYVPGTPATDETQLISFSYSGSNLVAPFSVTFSGDDGNSATTDYMAFVPFDGDGFLRNYTLSANLSAVPGANSLFFQFNTSAFSLGSFETFYFLTDVSGGWSMCAPGAGGVPLGGSCLAPSDFGTNAVYTLAAVPEPSELAMLSAGLLLLGVAARRSKPR